MSATLNTNNTLHISNYKKALMTIFDKKKAWNYLSEQREIALKRKETLEKTFMPGVEVMYH